MSERTRDVVKVIEKENVRFDTSGLLHFLSTESIKTKHLNDFDSIEGAVKLLNSMIYYEYHNQPTIESSFTTLYGQLDDRFALENAFEWIETYNDVMISNGYDDELLVHSCLTKSCAVESVREMYNDNNILVEKYQTFKRELSLRKIHDIDDDTSSYNCISVNSDEIVKECSKDYLDVYYEYMRNYTGSSIWNYLVPPEIRDITVSGSMSYRNGDFYTELNSIFRSGDDLTSSILKRNLNHFINVCRLMIFPASLSEELVVYRRDNYMEKTDNIKTSGFYSCSLSFDRVRDYNNTIPTGRIVRIRIPSGQRFLIVNSFRSGENEIVLMPSTYMRKISCIGNRSRMGNIMFCDYVVQRTYEMNRVIRNSLMLPIVRTIHKREIIKHIVKDIQ